MTPSPKALSLAVILLTAGLTVGAVPLLRGTLHYATLVMSAGDELRLGFVNYGVIDGKACETRLVNLAATLRKSCPTCRIAQECATDLSADQLRALSTEPLETASARLPDGVVTYATAAPGLALSICQESERQSGRAGAPPRVRCFAAGAPRPR